MSIATPFETPKVNLGVIAVALLFAALLVLLDDPIWLVRLVPTQDGPVHLAQADLIARFGWGGALQEPAASFYQWNPRIEPNSAIYLLLAALIRLTGDALFADSLFLSLYGLVWIVAAFAASRAETERPLLPALLLLPIVNADLIAQHDSHLFAWRIRPTLHAAQTAALAGRGVGLSSPLPSTRYFGYFPLQYVEARDFMRATPDWQDTPDVASVAKFRAANHGAPQVLIVSSSDQDGVAFAAKFGYGDCRTTQTGARARSMCARSQPG